MNLMRKTLAFILMLALVIGVGIVPSESLAADNSSNSILARDTEWKYLDNGVDLGTAWRSADFDDSAWKTGKAPLGFGDDFSETDPTLPIGTVVSYGSDPANKYMTTYLRKTVDVGDLAGYAALEVYIHVDDGAVVYINGTEAFRKGIADDVSVEYSSSAKYKIKEETFTIPVTALKTGKNTIAVEVHQDGGDSSDLWFEMSIQALTTLKPETPSTPEIVIPDPNAPIGAVSKVTVTFHGDTTTSKGFTWYTTHASANSDVQVVEKTSSTPDFSKAVKFTGKYSVSTNSVNELLHKTEATGLKPNTSYFFRVGDEKLDLWSEAGTFKTAPSSGAFTFINLADSQAKSEDEAILSSQTFAKAAETVKNSAFFSINGDLVDTGMNETQWDWLFGHSQKTLLNNTIVAAAGNHDEDKNSFIEHFDIKPADNSLTLTGAYYSYNYNNAHFVVLNNNEDSKEYADFTPAQIQWMKDDVAAARSEGYDWIIVFMHKGPYTTSNHAEDSDIQGSNGVRTLVAPIISELGVDLVLQGHDHIYARSKPIKNGQTAELTKITETLNGKSIEYTVKPDGTIYMIPATAGPKTYYKSKAMPQSYYDLFDVADENHAAVYGPDAGDASRPVRAVIQNFAGITIDGDKLTAVVYEIDQKKNNAQPYIVDQFGILKSDVRAEENSVTESPKATKSYTVVLGDALWKIARKYGTTWEKLQEMNHLKNPNLIFPGQKITIPTK